ncbi:PP2C family protein-serine/threonine phosphatase [Streptomyces canarius]
MALPLLLIAAITLAASFAPLAVHLSPLLVAAPTFTAAVAQTRYTVVMALAASAAVVLADWHDGLVRSPLLPVHVGALLAVSASVIAARALHDRDLRELTQVRAVSEATQRVLLRPLPRRLGSLRVASAYRATTAHAQVGGDLYAAARTGRATRILIGDVRGKGLPALEDAPPCSAHSARRPISTRRSRSWRLRWSAASALDEIAEFASDSAERFITALLVELPDGEETIRIVSCGHPPPLVNRRGPVTALCVTRPAPPLGLARKHGGGIPPRHLRVLSRRHFAALHRRAHRGPRRDRSFYPVLERAAAWAWQCPHGLLQDIGKDLRSYAGRHLDDDLAMVAVHSPARSCHVPATLTGPAPEATA